MRWLGILLIIVGLAMILGFFQPFALSVERPNYQYSMSYYPELHVGDIQRISVVLWNGSYNWISGVELSLYVDNVYRDTKTTDSKGQVIFMFKATNVGEHYFKILGMSKGFEDLVLTGKYKVVDITQEIQEQEETTESGGQYVIGPNQIIGGILAILGFFLYRSEGKL